MEQPDGHLHAHTRIDLGSAFHSRGMEMVGDADDAPLRFQKPSRLRNSHPELPIRHRLLLSSLLSPNLLPKCAPILTLALCSTDDPFCGGPIHLLDSLRPIHFAHEALWRDHMEWIRTLDSRHRSHSPFQQDDPEMGAGRDSRPRGCWRRKRIPTNTSSSPSTFSET